MLYAILGVMLVGALGGAAYFIHRALSNRVALGQRDAALQIERERVAKMERAADEARAARQKELDAEIADVRDATAAAELLRRHFPGPGTPEAD